ncbi:MAG: hypothetical protein ACYS6W_16915 [Planctomycetota bacterium]|jgi:hypothetical protein
METSDDWQNDIAQEIGGYKDKFSKKDSKKCKLDLLARVTKRVAGFSADCNECRQFQGEITKLVEDLGDLVDASKENRKNHLKVISTIIKHLQKRHKLKRYKLICEGEYTMLGMVMGLVFGSAIGAAVGNVAIGIPVGMGVGMAIGFAMEVKAKKDGKVI